MLLNTLRVLHAQHQWGALLTPCCCCQGHCEVLLNTPRVVHAQPRRVYILKLLLGAVKGVMMEC